LQIAGSSGAALIMLTTMIENPPNLISIPVLLVMYAILGLGFISGIWLWNGETRGHRYSILIQALQVPIIFSTLVTYKFIFGFGAYFVLLGGPFDVHFQIGSYSVLYIFPANPTPFLGLNIFALIAMSHLIRRLRAADNQQEVPTSNAPN
jgi:hypothetical protein